MYDLNHMGGGSSSGLFPLVSFTVTCITIHQIGIKLVLNLMSEICEWGRLMQQDVVLEPESKVMHEEDRLCLGPYSFSLRGDLCAFIHSFDPRGIRRSRPEVSFQLLHLRLQRASTGLPFHLVHVHVQLVPLLFCTLNGK